MASGITRRQSLYENAKRNRVVALNSYRFGWLLDPTQQAKCAEQVDRHITEADQEIRKICTELQASFQSDADRKFLASFNPNSGQQLAHLFYRLLDEPVKIRTKQGAASTGKAALEHIQTHGGQAASQLAYALKKRKTNAKLREAYINNLQGVRIIRPSAHVTAQVGGRWSYKDPALTTTPPFIRPMFIAFPGKWMVLADLAGAEFRSGALLARCTQMIEAFAQGRDLHWETAEIMFGTTRDKLDKKTHRQMAKVTGLAMNYATLDLDVAAAGIFANIGHRVPGLTYNMVLGAVKRLAAARPEVIAHKEQVARDIRTRDYIEEPFSMARRYFYGKPKDQEAWNFENQRQIAFVAETAAQAIDAEFRPGEGLHLNKFDELILGGPDPARLAELLWRHLRQTRTLDGQEMTYEIEIEVTKRWGESVKIEPLNLGKSFGIGCSCKFHAECVTVGEAARVAAEHYMRCEKMNPPDERIGSGKS